MKRALLLLLSTSLLLPQANTSKEDILWQYRNRGKAFYENPTTQNLAVAEFQKALALNPSSSRERLNYALALLRAAKTAEAVAELKKVQTQDPSLPHTWFNLGIHHKKQGDTAEAIRLLERMLQLVPNEPITIYNLGVLYKLQGDTATAIARFQQAAQLNPTLAAPHFQLFNSYRLAGQPDAAKKELALFQEMKKAQEASGSTEDMEWNDYAEIYDPIDPSFTAADNIPYPEIRFAFRSLSPQPFHGLLTLDADNDGKTDLLAWSNSAPAQLFKSAAAPPSPLPAGHAFTAADYNNDGAPDLAFLTPTSAELLTNRHPQWQRQTLATGAFRKIVWLDYDHDSDLDILLIGPQSTLLRNQGEAGFAPRPTDFPFPAGDPVDAIPFRLIPDTKAFDLIVTYRDRPTVLFRDRLAAKYDPIDLPLVPPSATHLTATDFNHDGALDLAFLQNNQLALARNFKGQLQSTPAPPVSSPFTLGDFANMAVFDFLSTSIQPLAGPPRKAPNLPAASALLTADFNNDGRLDLALATPTGLSIATNTTVTTNRYISVKLEGVKNLKLSPFAEVEIKAGRRYQKQIYSGTPLHFGLRAIPQIDTIRITWPNGLIQNEARQLPNRLATVKEAPRLSGSCPMIFTWDGAGFRFITDVLGVAPLGASSGDGQYFPTDHDEYVWINGDALVPVNGQYQLRITEELAEVSYLDQIKLLAVDHPKDLQLFSNDKWKSPPYPDFRLYGTRRRIKPIARSGAGTTELSFPLDTPAQHTFLVLTGWVDWADGSTFLNRSQARQDLLPPSLQMRDANGHWRTVIEDMGMPSGKTKTIAIDLHNKWISAHRDLRIVTNMRVFWTDAFLGVESTPPRYTLHTSPLRSADLRFHGFSDPRIHPQRLEPETFRYSPTTNTTFWNPTPGLYTRYGDVRPLLQSVDDQFVILGSGDEIALHFQALPPVAPGFRRDFLLYVDGWAKDSDPNTAHGQSVEPLPFHGMSQYPYPPTESYPQSPAHIQYRKHYNTRPALRLLRQLAP